MASKQIDSAFAAGWLRAVSNQARLRIVLRLLEGERSVSELEGELQVRQPNLSQHLAELRNANLVVTRRKVKSVYYRLADEGAKRFARALMQGFGTEPELPPVTSSVDPSVERVIQAAVFAQIERRLD